MYLLCFLEDTPHKLVWKALLNQLHRMVIWTHAIYLQPSQRTPMYHLHHPDLLWSVPANGPFMLHLLTDRATTPPPVPFSRGETHPIPPPRSSLRRKRSPPLNLRVAPSKPTKSWVPECRVPSLRIVGTWSISHQGGRMTKRNTVFIGRAIRKPTSYSASHLMKGPRLFRLLGRILAVHRVVLPTLSGAMLPI